MIQEHQSSLRLRHTFGMDLYAEEWIEFSSEEEISAFVKDGRLDHRKYLVAGAGSNLLFCGNYQGVVLHSAIRDIEISPETDGTVCVRAGSGVVWDDLVAYCVTQGWGGLENLSHIPGEVGASAVQNIGAYGTEVSETIVSVEAVRLSDGSLRHFPAETCDYAYRHSAFKDLWKGQYFITYVTYRLSTRPELNVRYEGLSQRIAGITHPTLSDVRNAVIEIRREKLPDPLFLGNAGSFFMNPVITRDHYNRLRETYPDLPHYAVDAGHVKVPAGWLIEQCGWKGKSIGRAAVHERQALILVNRGGATATEVLHLAEEICASVRKKFGIELKPEVNYVY